MAREQLTVTLELLTPLFLSGADQTKAEIRVPSIRGVMRYWFRTMMGGILGGRYQEVRKIEAQVWGDTGHASGVTIRLIQDNTRSASTKDLDNTIPKGSKSHVVGHRYLLYSTILKRGANYQRPVYLNNEDNNDQGQFTLDVRFPADLCNLILGTLWLVGNFGSLGTRARRGLGAIRIASSNPACWEGVDLSALASDPEEQASLFTTGLAKVAQTFESYVGDRRDPRADLPEFPCFLRDFYQVRVLDASFDSWNKALDCIGQRYAAYRRSKRVEEREGFGLPIVRLGAPPIEGRRASPLFIRPFAMKGQKEGESPHFGLMVLFFKSQFLSRKEGWSAIAEPRGGYQVVEEFLATLNGTAVEVRLNGS